MLDTWQADYILIHLPLEDTADCRTESALWMSHVRRAYRGYNLTFGIDRRNSWNTTGDRSTTVHPILA